MAVALRPAVLLIVLASLLFFAAGILDTAQGTIDASAVESWVFGAVNLIVAILIARGNERILALRIGLAAFFMVERPVTAVAFGAKPIEGIALHMAAAILEAVILISTLRIWRLGHSVSRADLAMLSLPGAPAPLLTASAAPSGDVAVAGPVPSSVVPRRGRQKRPRAPRPAQPRDAAPGRDRAFALTCARSVRGTRTSRERSLPE